MYGLPLKQRITIRQVTKPLRDVVTCVEPRWQGDRVSVEITDDVTVVNSYNGGHYVSTRLFNLETGVSAPLDQVPISQRHGTTCTSPRWNASYGVSGTITPGDALVVLRGSPALGSRRRADVTFYLKHFSTLYDVLEQLEVARDAMHMQDIRTAMRMAREVLPHSYGLFIALIQREVTMLSSSSREAP